MSALERPDYRRLHVFCDQRAAIPHTARMGMMTQLLERLGFVRLRDYGLTLTPDGRVVPMDIAPPPEPIVFVAPLPEPFVVVAPPPEPAVVAPVPTAMRAKEPDDDWDWEIAVARARATAEPPPVPVTAPSLSAVPPRVTTPSLPAVRPSVAALPALPLPPPPPSAPTEPRVRTIIAVPALPAADPQAIRHYDSATRRALPAPRRFPRATNHGTARNGSSRH